MRTTVRTVYTWKKRYEKEGIEGLRTKEKTGRKRKLSDEDMERIKDLSKKKNIGRQKKRGIL